MAALDGSTSQIEPLDSNEKASREKEAKLQATIYTLRADLQLAREYEAKAQTELKEATAHSDKLIKINEQLEAEVCQLLMHQDELEKKLEVAKAETKHMQNKLNAGKQQTRQIITLMQKCSNELDLELDSDSGLSSPPPGALGYVSNKKRIRSFTLPRLPLPPLPPEIDSPPGQIDKENLKDSSDVAKQQLEMMKKEQLDQWLSGYDKVQKHALNLDSDIKYDRVNPADLKLSGKSYPASDLPYDTVSLNHSDPPYDTVSLNHSDPPYDTVSLNHFDPPYANVSKNPVLNRDSDTDSDSMDYDRVSPADIKIRKSYPPYSKVSRKLNPVPNPDSDNDSDSKGYDWVNPADLKLRKSNLDSESIYDRLPVKPDPNPDSHIDSV